MIIEDINAREDLILMNVDSAALEIIKTDLSSKERSALKGIFGNTECRTLGAISFFVKLDESGTECKEIFAFSGQVPNLCKALYPIRESIGEI